MTPFEALSLFLALLAVFIAVRIKRPVVISGTCKKRLQVDVEEELNRTRLKVFEKEAKKRQKLRQAAKKRNRVKGRFA